MHPSLSSWTAAAGDAMLQALLEHGPYRVIAIDGQYRILSINGAVEGLDVLDMIGTSVLDHVPPDRQAGVRSVIDEVLRSGAPGQFEARGRVADGSIGWWDTQVLPVQSHAGAARALLLATDVTARRRAEAALRTSEARYRALVEASADVVYRMGPDWTEMRQLDGHDFIADSPEPSRDWLTRYIPAADRAEVLDAVNQAIRDRRPFELEHRVQRIDGSLGWTRSRAVPMLDEHGAVVEWVGAASDVTARREVQWALAESEERLRLAMEAAEEGLWDWNLQTGACYFSAAYHAMLGYPPGFIGRDVSGVQALLHPEDLGVLSQGPVLLRAPGHFVMRFRLRHADGDYRWIESRGKTVQRDAAGEPVRAVGTHLDITERLRLEDALRRSETLLRAIVEGTTDAVFVKDRAGRYLLVNQAVCDVTGLSAEALLGHDASVFLPAEAARAMAAADRDLMAAGEVVSVAETLDWIDGQRRSFLTTKGPLRDPGGQVIGMFGIAREVTELLRSEEAQRRKLQESRDLLDMALAGGELGAWATDLTTGASRFDERYLAMLGLRPGELAPTMQAWLARIHPDDRAAVDEAVAAHLRGETRVCETEHRLRHKDGHWIWVLARGKVMRDADGQPMRAVGTHLDITDRKRAASEGAQLLQKIEALLGGLVQHRVADADGRAAAATADRPPGAAALSARQREVLDLLARGLTAAEIATRLGISPETANTHRRDLMRRLGLRNKAELIRYALEQDMGHAAGLPKRR